MKYQSFSTLMDKIVRFTESPFYTTLTPLISTLLLLVMGVLAVANISADDDVAEGPPAEITSPTDGALMRLIPAGEFEMGDHFDDGADDDLPVHTVYLDDFYIDVYEVTNAQYKKFMEEKGHRAPPFWNDSQYNLPNHPVVGVNWHDAVAYAKWAGKQLPTEAQWEKAARGGLVGKRYVWGDSPTPPQGAGNLADEAAKRAFPSWTVFEGYDDGYARTAPVGSFSPNGYGVHDMAGNVWEWCLDEVDVIFYVNSPHDNPIAGGPLVNIVDNFLNVKTDRIRRGGSGFFPPGEDPEWLVGVSRRSGGPPSTTAPNVGFRCVTEQW
jgi:formylglycine-generating enzyme required for sulfatase activity